MYVVWYLVRAVSTKYGRSLSLKAAEKGRRKLRNRGLTAWIEKEDGTFVPVKGAMRKPGSREQLSEAEQKKRLNAALKGM
jgi:hypothetical protein